MTYPWTIEGFPERIEYTGWPEWEHQNRRLRLDVTLNGRFLIRRSPSRKRSQYPKKITNHEAACLIRESWREWLGGYGIWICPADDKELGNYAISGGAFTGPPNRLTYDAAQAAAIDAVRQEKKHETEPEAV